MNTQVMFSSKSDEWSTPQEVFDELNNEFNFNLDPCSTELNHKCSNYYTKESDGLSKNWGGTESLLIHLIRRLENGSRKHIMKGAKITPLLCC